MRFVRLGRLLPKSTKFKKLRIHCRVDAFWQGRTGVSAAGPIEVKLLQLATFGNKLDLIEVNLRVLKLSHPGVIPHPWKSFLRRGIMSELERIASHRGAHNSPIHETEKADAVCMYQTKNK